MLCPPDIPYELGAQYGQNGPQFKELLQVFSFPWYALTNDAPRVDSSRNVLELNTRAYCKLQTALALPNVESLNLSDGIWPSARGGGYYHAHFSYDNIFSGILEDSLRLQTLIFSNTKQLPAGLVSTLIRSSKTTLETIAAVRVGAVAKTEILASRGLTCLQEVDISFSPRAASDLTQVESKQLQRIHLLLSLQ